MWLAASFGTANLHASERSAAQVILISWAVLCGLAAGLLVSRRRGRSDEVLFSVTAGALAGAMCGGAYALVLGLTYVATYGGTPVDFSDAVLLVISYPVFAALGALLGSVPGALLGLCGGLLLRREPAAVRYR